MVRVVVDGRVRVDVKARLGLAQFHNLWSTIDSVSSCQCCSQDRREVLIVLLIV